MTSHDCHLMYSQRPKLIWVRLISSQCYGLKSTLFVYISVSNGSMLCLWNDLSSFAFLFFHALIPVKTPEESVSRFQKVLRLVKSGSTKLVPYNSMGVDHNTIFNQAPIAELAAVSPDMFKILRAGFKKGDNLLKFAEKCMAQCILEPNASKISAMKWSMVC